MVNLKIVCEQKDCGADKLTVNKGKRRNSRARKGDCETDERAVDKTIRMVSCTLCSVLCTQIMLHSLKTSKPHKRSDLITLTYNL